MVILSVNADQLLSIPSCWLLFRTLFLVISLLLSPSTQLAVSHYLVKFLPGFEGPLPFQLETGYVGVDESEDVQLFYYFVKSDSNPKEDPLVLWFTGGPGCSSFTAFAYEIGPLNFEAVQLQENGSLPKLVLNPNSWTKGASIIFVDLPVGTGFSYPRTSVASHSTDLQSCDQAYQFMMKWLIDHPEFLMNPFYVGGDSYSGITVPPVAQMISDGNEIGNKPFINLKGYVLGNPVTFLDGGESNYAIPFAYGKGLISGELFESLQRNCQGEYFNVDPSNADCLQDVQAYYQCTNGLQPGQILEPVCGFASPKPSELFSKRSLYAKNWEHVLPEHSLCAFARVDGYRISYRWLDEDSVREALHIRKGSIGKWIRCNYGVSYTYTFTNSYQYHVNLSAKGYRSLIYSGDHDMIVPFLATQAWIRSLNYSIVDDWRSWIVQGQVAGYTRTYSNRMTYATVKGGGHTAPEYKPLECLAMFKRWISHKPL